MFEKLFWDVISEDLYDEVFEVCHVASMSLVTEKKTVQLSKERENTTPAVLIYNATKKRCTYLKH